MLYTKHMKAIYTVYSFSKTYLSEKLGISKRTISAWRKEGKPLPVWALRKLDYPPNDGVVRTRNGERIVHSILTQGSIPTKYRRSGNHFDIPENEYNQRFRSWDRDKVTFNI